MNNFLLVFLGGGLGSVLRYGIYEFVKTNFKAVFPFATLCSNVISCIVLSLAVIYFNEKTTLSLNVRMLVAVGFCGGFSTFSTFGFETVELIRSGNTTIAFLNVLISISVCVALIYFITKRI